MTMISFLDGMRVVNNRLVLRAIKSAVMELWNKMSNRSLKMLIHLMHGLALQAQVTCQTNCLVALQMHLLLTKLLNVIYLIHGMYLQTPRMCKVVITLLRQRKICHK
uniref:Uncharacterized protein n=1 Tax=Opuntia streptacantha TaxID=393608 RepID=A0A7C9EHT1_OPUST